ncbi:MULTISPECIES: uracil-xanthine permease family protein [unclassified Oceanobacter]|uniref:uracil-xanthine permease family protein n=2 Tax=Gammaproteobacteria TaxID=1236 RepID=UPI0026E48C78|nr:MULTISPECIES: nucleobase:cation symporter-2 family protein [unclassified Oceanobacter]MDO6683080.1 nucleobase:cation symporter-2 family protein [Oceanobacter sp. 5_MG-2023]MDP2505887.1 nucleobase:cation symporter-2 family protein [Oceanobacter sp. 3_MG-2023]MDP2548382.1 nucleobase:cation symporter-2 family protein [Oceanobacter sp. 4_MG-2023]MDP2608365.1 nucleobase:cation symporter-2 family protein [Oceanobacter sp. 1_MG-2023]MDP2611460.1 nucleobase:cation symporter-2 family protein [Oceano
MSDHQSNDLLYPLDARPGALESSFAAIQHVLASFVGIITPTLIVGGVLGLGEHIPYLISMALMVSGVATVIQARRPFGIGAGMICVQGTSFAFLSSVLAAGFIAKGKGGGPEEILSLIFGVCFLGAFVEIFLSQFLHKLKSVITPLVTGIVITIIGVSLIKVGMTDLAGGFKSPDFGSPANLALGGLVLLSIIVLNRSSNSWIRLSSIVIGLVIGFVAAAFMGKISFDNLASLPAFSIPVPFKYGFSFDWTAFAPIALIYLITAIESTGDLTANCIVSHQPIKGESYIQRVKGGVLADGINSLLAALFNSMPNTTFSQNNGVIQLTGVASRYIGYYIGAVLFILGMFPIIGGVLQNIPKPVLGGATLVMFGTVAAAGVKILATEHLDRRKMLIMAVSFGMGLGVIMTPNLLAEMPKLVQSIFGSAITTGGLAAIIMSALLPEEKTTAAAQATMTTATEKTAGTVS